MSVSAATAVSTDTRSFATRCLASEARRGIDDVAEGVEAYMPGFTMFAWGMGMNGDEWPDAIERALDGLVAGPPDHPARC